MNSAAGLLLAVAAGVGVHLLWTAAHGERSIRPRPASPGRSSRTVRDWLVQAGLEDVAAGEFAGVMAGRSVPAGRESALLIPHSDWAARPSQRGDPRSLERRELAELDVDRIPTPEPFRATGRS